MSYFHIAATIFHPLPKALQQANLDNPLICCGSPKTKNTARAYARAAARILVAMLEDYWEEHVSSDVNEFPELDVRMIHNGAMVIYYDRALHEHRGIVSFVAYPVEQVTSDSMVLYRGCKIYRNANGYYVFDDTNLKITRSDTIEQTFAKIDLALGNVSDCVEEDKNLPPQKAGLKRFCVTMESMCEEGLQTSIWVSAEDKADAMNTANDMVSDNEYRAVSAVECTD